MERNYISIDEDFDSEYAYCLDCGNEEDDCKCLIAFGDDVEIAMYETDEEYVDEDYDYA